MSEICTGYRSRKHRFFDLGCTAQPWPSWSVARVRGFWHVLAPLLSSRWSPASMVCAPIFSLVCRLAFKANSFNKDPTVPSSHLHRSRRFAWHLEHTPIARMRTPNETKRTLMTGCDSMWLYDFTQHSLETTLDPIRSDEVTKETQHYK